MAFIFNFGGPHKVALCWSIFLSSMHIAQQFHCVVMLYISPCACFHQLHSFVTSSSLFFFIVLSNFLCGFLSSFVFFHLLLFDKLFPHFFMCLWIRYYIFAFVTTLPIHCIGFFTLLWAFVLLSICVFKIIVVVFVCLICFNVLRVHFQYIFCCISCAQLANIFGMLSLCYLLFHQWQLFWELAPRLLFVSYILSPFYVHIHLFHISIYNFFGFMHECFFLFCLCLHLDFFLLMFVCLQISTTSYLFK